MAAAQADVEAAERRTESTRHNNPNRGRAGLQRARLTLDVIVSICASGASFQRRSRPKSSGWNSGSTNYSRTQKAARRSNTRASATADALPRRACPTRRKTVMEWARWWEEVR